MRRKIGYAKLGRSMPLRLENCGSLGGDVEMVPTLKLLAERHPDVDFILIGRNSGETARQVGLPDNVYNPWRDWQFEVRRELNRLDLNYPNLSIEDHVRVADVIGGVTEGEFLKLDGLVMWLGQHGTTNTPLPKIGDRSQLTKPYDWSTLYASYLLRGINAWRDVDPWNREEVLLNADVRNYVKFRDAKWPWRRSVIGQYDQVNVVKHERYGDPSQYWKWNEKSLATPTEASELWQSKLHTTYERLEISALVPGTPFGDTITFNDDHDRPHDFGIVVNETRREVNPAKARVNVLKEWVLPLNPGFIHGKWSEKSIGELRDFAFSRAFNDDTPFDIKPISQLGYIAKLQTTRCTLTTPASGSGWATAKPWEAFAAGVVCFFHPAYDDQDNILGDADVGLREYLRVKTPDELRHRIRQLTQAPKTWLRIIELQRRHFENAVGELRYLKVIEERLGL